MIPCPGGLDAKDRPDNPVERCSMAIEVRIPTILRTYTDGAKQVEGTGSTLGELLTDLEQRHGGLRDRLIDNGGDLRRFVNVYLNDEDEIGRASCRERV